MSWNEPGQGGRDPWNRDNHKHGSSKGPQWDDLLKKLQSHLGRFGKGNKGLVVVIVAVLVIWLLLSSYTVIGPRETGVVLRFGQYQRDLPSGFHLKLPNPVEHVYKVNTSKVRTVSDSVKMLTNDENIVNIDFNIQWQVSDARKYLFALRNPDQTINHAAESAVRAVVGANPMNTILSGEGAELVGETRMRLQEMLDGYDAGLLVTKISFQKVEPPHQVRNAFDDVNKAREDKQRFENEARAYASRVIPIARGKAARIAAEASAYQQVREARAEGDVERFEQILTQYHAAPEVTRKRLWIEAMEDVLSAQPKVIDGSKGRNVLYLKLDGEDVKGEDAKQRLPGANAAIQGGSLTPQSDADGGSQ